MPHAARSEVNTARQRSPKEDGAKTVKISVVCYQITDGRVEPAVRAPVIFYSI